PSSPPRRAERGSAFRSPTRPCSNTAAGWSAKAAHGRGPPSGAPSRGPRPPRDWTIGESHAPAPRYPCRGMHALVHRLVERLTQGGPPFWRSRHFHTFESPEGKLALRIARRLRSVARDIARASEPPRFQREAERIRLVIPLPDGARTTWLSLWEWQLLSR